MKLLLSLPLVYLACSAAFAGPVMLVTEREYVESRDNPLQLSPKSVPAKDAPTIEVLTPDISGPISSPTPILLRFTPKAPAVIKPESFKAYYGTFQIDITDRLLSVTKVGLQGIDIKEAALPKGEHRLTLNVQDSEGRAGSKTIAFEIK